MSHPQVPISIKLIGWILIVGAIWTLGMTAWSWAHFDLWRSAALSILKGIGLVAGLALTRGLRFGAYLYWISVIATTAIFYIAPPRLPGIELYFSFPAVTIALLAPAIITSFILLNWHRLR